MVFLNPRTGASATLEDPCNLLGNFSNILVDIDLLFQKMAGQFCTDVAIIRDDYREIIDVLVHEELVNIDDDVPASGMRLEEKDSSGPSKEYDVYDLFKQTGICSELHIDLTSACTERCVHCYLPDYPDKYLPYDLVEKALREFRAHQGVTVELTGGECMLHPDFGRICRLCNELNLNFIVMSNMTRCDMGMVSLLREVEPQFVNVSLYSMDEQVHDAITTIAGSWRKTMDAILACERAGVHVRIATPLLKENRQSFKALKEFSDVHHMHFVPDYHILPQTNHDSSNLEHACSACELRVVLQANKEIFDCHWEDAPLRAAEDKVCDIGVGRLYLNSLGKYYPCAAMHDYVIGDVRENTFEEVWRGKEMEKLRALKVRDMENCADCTNRRFCKVCPAYNFNATGDLCKSTGTGCSVAEIVAEVYGKGQKGC